VQCKMLIFNSIDGMRGTECRGLRGMGQRHVWRSRHLSRSRAKRLISTGNVWNVAKDLTVSSFFLNTSCCQEVFP